MKLELLNVSEFISYMRISNEFHVIVPGSRRMRCGRNSLCFLIFADTAILFLCLEVVFREEGVWSDNITKPERYGVWYEFNARSAIMIGWRPEPTDPDER